MLKDSRCCAIASSISLSLPRRGLSRCGCLRVSPGPASADLLQGGDGMTVVRPPAVSAQAVARRPEERQASCRQDMACVLCCGRLGAAQSEASGAGVFLRSWSALQAMNWWKFGGVQVELGDFCSLRVWVRRIPADRPRRTGQVPANQTGNAWGLPPVRLSVLSLEGQFLPIALFVLSRGGLSLAAHPTRCQRGWRQHL